MTERYDAIVIGAGSNGLAAATALARAGKRALVLERADAVGGQARSLEFAPGFHAAPLGLDASWIPPTVARGLGVAVPETVQPDPHVTVAAGAGSFLGLSADPARVAQTIRAHSPTDADRWPAFTARLRGVAGFLERLYQLPAPDVQASTPGELLDLARMGWRFRRLGRERMTDALRMLPMAVAELLDDAFECEALKAAVAAGAVADVRQGPRSGGTTFALLHRLVGAPAGSVRGRGHWRAGPAALVSALEHAARAAGVMVRTGAAVDRIAIADYAATGVVLRTGEEVAASAVLSSADPARTLLGMVDPEWLDPEFAHAVRTIKLRGATAYVLFALDGLPEFPGLEAPALAGTVTLSPTVTDLERSYDAAKYGRASAHPHVELCVPTLRWPAGAPPGKHVAVAAARCAPYDLRDGAGWTAERREALTDRVAGAIRAAAPAFADRVLHRATLVPPDLEERFGLTEGAATHGELTLDQILFMRPVPGWGRYEMPVRGLYLCGRGAHPGPGIGGGAGWLAARRVLQGA